MHIVDEVAKSTFFLGQWNMDPFKVYFLLKMGIFHCYVSLPDFLGGGFKYVLFLPLVGEDFHMD